MEQTLTQTLTQTQTQYPYNLSDYNVSLNNHIDWLSIELCYDETLFKAKITQNDLKSGLVTLDKLANIIRINSKQTQPNYFLNLTSHYNQRTNLNTLVLNINYSNEFIDFQESIYFYQVIYFYQANTYDDAKFTKYNQIIQTQNNRIEKLENTIGEMNEKIEKLEKQIICICEIETERRLEIERKNKLEIHKFDFGAGIVLVPKKINKMTISKEYLNYGLCKTLLIFIDFQYYNLDGNKIIKRVFRLPYSDNFINKLNEFIEKIKYIDICNIIFDNNDSDEPTTNIYAILLEKILSSKPDFIFNTIKGGSKKILNKYSNYKKVD